MKPFMNDDFLLETDTAKELYHSYASKMPIFDYHCHLPPEEIAQNKKFENIAQIWLNGDHYKWRVMRTNGIPEMYCTGNASDREKFSAWAKTVPYCIGNPVYHWTHLELKDPFGISGKVLSPETEEYIWNRCNSRLAEDSFSVHGLLRHFNVKGLCTTDDPVDSLKHHIAIKKSGLGTRVLPTFRPDKITAVEKGDLWREYILKLGETEDIEINTYAKLLDVIKLRHDYFHATGCRLADHGIYLPVFRLGSENEVREAFLKAISGKTIPVEEQEILATDLMLFMGRLHAGRGWVMQLHIGAQRNNNTRLYRSLGPDTGFDSIADGPVAAPLGAFLDELDKTEQLPKTILYVLNPRDNELIASLIGCFQDGSVPGKIQFGSGWWFNDQKDGMIRQMTSLAQLGLLSRFVGMLTDSRSFLSYPRHEYFRRILCNMVGGWIENGEAPDDLHLTGKIIQDISYNNVSNFIELDED